MFERAHLHLAIAIVVSSCGGGAAPLRDPPLVQEAVAQSDDLIVPGKRVGPFRLGMYMDEVIRKFGQPLSRLDPLDWAARFDYGNVVLNFTGNAAPWVDTISVYGGSYHTAEGIHVGSSMFDVARTNGPSCQSDWACPGIQFWHDNRYHTVAYINVRSP